MMTTLLRAPRDCGSWMWFPEHVSPGLLNQYALAARVVEITTRHGLLFSPRVTSDWRVNGVVVNRALSTVQADGPLDDPAVLAAVTAARPEGLAPDAEPGTIQLAGPGTWLDAHGAAHEEDTLVRIDVHMVAADGWLNMDVFHDIWMPYDFAARPHPEVFQRNAPRLAATITEISALLGSEAEPGEHTYFGHSVALGVENTVDDHDLPLDVTDVILNRT